MDDGFSMEETFDGRRPSLQDDFQMEKTAGVNIFQMWKKFFPNGNEQKQKLF